MIKDDTPDERAPAPVEGPTLIAVYDGDPLKPALDGDAGIDLRAKFDGPNIVLRPGQREPIPTGIRLAIPRGFAGLILPRSGLALQYGVTVANSPGLIDSGYRGEVIVVLANHGEERFIVQSGERIAQLVVIQPAFLPIVQASELDETERGDAGFGSTGVA